MSTPGRELAVRSAGISRNGDAGPKVLDGDGRSSPGVYFISGTAVMRLGGVETPLPRCPDSEKGFKAALQQGVRALCTPQHRFVLEPGTPKKKPKAPQLLPPPPIGAQTPNPPRRTRSGSGSTCSCRAGCKPQGFSDPPQGSLTPKCFFSPQI